ncbi:poly-gamma-glutamate hydrolase family protein [Peribacillus aracenensis]|uniref:poly-gamma-glutamate hydrolase family protein n=1 Tax=Peribacillus aracenensis TaxID=2976708 RepID=UPI0021A46B94|nr:poly-gamma-glutamate hydrolase family protein [Peribacillus sp. BBB004]
MMTPHGGGIEVGTSELVLFAAKGMFSEYAFEGCRTSNNRELHITTTNFDEPICLDMVRETEHILAFHGYADTTNKHTLIGGRDTSAKQSAFKALNTAGFSCEIVPVGGYLAGNDPNNICNKGPRGMGLKLEISTAQRNAFFGTNTRAKRRHTTLPEFHKYVEAITSIYNPVV